MKVITVLSLVFMLGLAVLSTHASNAGPIEGSSTAVFVNPQPTCPPAVCTGEGTNFFTWGEPGEPPDGHVSSLDYQSVTFTTSVGEEFDVGEVVFFNGTITSDTGVSEVDLCIEVTTVDLNTYADCRRVYMINTPNTSDPEASADGVSMHMGPDFHVYENQDARGTVRARLVNPLNTAVESGGELELEILGFGEIIGEGGFLIYYSYLPIIQR